MNPTIVFGITPGGVPVHARRDFASLAVLPMPRRSGSGHETLVHRRVLRIGHSFGDGSLALKANRHAEEPMGAAVAAKIGGSRRKTPVAQPGSDLRPLLAQKPILRRFRLLLFEHTVHNQRRDQPIRNFQFGAASLARALTLSSLKHWDSHYHQPLQALARLGLPAHPWGLPQLTCFLFAKKKHNYGDPMRLGQLNYETPSTFQEGWQSTPLP